MRKDRETMILWGLFLGLLDGCTNVSSIQKTKENAYIKYKNSFFIDENYKDKRVKYFEGSYRENQSSSFEPMIPAGELTKEDAQKIKYYYKVMYNNNHIVEGSAIDNNKMTTKIYYDEKGRKIKQYWYRDNSFEIIKFHGEDSLDRIYCNGRTKKCTTKHYTKEEDQKLYDESAQDLVFDPNE